MAEQVRTSINTAYGGFWIRFLALMVDTAIIFVVGGALVAGAGSALGLEAVLPVYFAVWLAGFLYWPLMQASARQATFGKAMLGLRVTGYSGERISILRSFGRELSKIISGAVLLVGYLVAAFTPRKQALHDLAASTYVSSEGPSHIGRALGVVLAGFVLLPVLGAMLFGGAIMEMASAMMGQQDVRTVQKAERPAPKVIAVTQKPIAARAPVSAPAPALVSVPAPVSTTETASFKAAAAPAPAPVAPPVLVKTVPAATKDATARPAAATPRPMVSIAWTPPPVAPGPVINPSFNDLMTAVMYRDVAGVNQLLALGKWPDKVDSNGYTPLMAAVMIGDAASAEALLKGGADSAHGAPNGHSALSMARARGDSAMLDLLKRYGSR